MTSFQFIKNSFVTFSLVIFLAVVAAFGLSSESGLAANTLSPRLNQSLPSAAMDRMIATGINLEGKGQEAIGNITGDPKDQAMGKAKQAKGQADRAATEIRANVKVQGRTKAVAKNLEGKAQEGVGSITDNSKHQAAGKLKQGESQARNALEDVKEKIQDIFN